MKPLKCVEHTNHLHWTSRTVNTYLYACMTQSSVFKIIMAECYKKPKRIIPIYAFNKWQVQFDEEYSTLSWLWCDKDSSGLVETLWCATYKKYESSIMQMKNFFRSRIISTNHYIACCITLILHCCWLYLVQCLSTTSSCPVNWDFAWILFTDNYSVITAFYLL